MMNYKIKEGYWDLYAIILLSTLFSLIVLIFPNLELLRIILGFLFIAFLPGYVTISIIWPMKYKNEEYCEQINNIDDLKYKKKLFELNEYSNVERKSINIFVRIAFSIGMSILISSFIGFIFNELYIYNNSYFGIKILPNLLTIYLFIMIGSAIAIYRREKIPKDQRFLISFRIISPFDNTLHDKLITITLILLILLSSIFSIFLYKYYHNNEKYSEFYILGNNKKISDYPNNIFVNEEILLYIGIVNNEYKDIEYEMRFFLEHPENFSDNTISNNIILSPKIGYSFFTNIENNENFQSPLYIKINESGDFTIYFQLLINENIYRELKLKIKVFKNDDMKYNNIDNYKLFLETPSGKPGGFPMNIDDNYTLNIILGLENLDNKPKIFNISIFPENPLRWYFDIDREFPIINNTGYYFYIDLDENSSIKINLNIYMYTGLWSLFFNINNDIKYTINKNVYVH